MTVDTPRRGYHRHTEGQDRRRCPRCALIKPIEEFALPSGRIHGHCRPCRRAVNQEWRARHHDELLARRRAAYGPVGWGWQLRRAWTTPTEEEETT